MPTGLTCALHILQHTLKKVVTEKVIKRPQIAVDDMIEFEHFACNIVIAGNEWDDYIPALLKRIVRTEYWGLMKNTNVRIDTKHIVIPCIM